MKVEISNNGDVIVVVTPCALLEQTPASAGVSNTGFARTLSIIAGGASGGALQ